MAIKWWNIRSKEVRVSETEPHTAAMWASSDHSPNITQGQDFGWRLAPEVVVEMKRIKQHLPTLLEIAQSILKNTDEITEPDILMYISAKSEAENAPVAGDGDYTDEYDAEIRRLQARAEEESSTSIAPVVPAESLADMEKRVELEERMAKAKREQAELDAAAATTTTTTEAPTTTTTTVAEPTTTTTTAAAGRRTTTTTTEGQE